MRHGDQKNIARWAGLSQTMLCQIFKGVKRPSPSTARKLEERTGIDLRDWLFMPHEQLKQKVYLGYLVSHQDGKK
jgi:DNA-binding transcriptional regulator YdaS (Cro superfamily)